MFGGGGGGSASSAWHIDQMGQPPRLGCLGMCTGQCAVVGGGGGGCAAARETWASTEGGSTLVQPTAWPMD